MNMHVFSWLVFVQWPLGAADVILWQLSRFKSGDSSPEEFCHQNWARTLFYQIKPATLKTHNQAYIVLAQRKTILSSITPNKQEQRLEFRSSINHTLG